jgi:hypothetical protein
MGEGPRGSFKDCSIGLLPVLILVWIPILYFFEVSPERWPLPKLLGRGV